MSKTEKKTEATTAKVLIDRSEQTPVPSRNNVVLTGTVLQTFAPNGNVTIMTLAVGQRELSQYPKITWYGKDAMMVAKEFPPGTKSKHQKVCVSGFIQTSKRDVKGETKYFQNIVGENLSYAPKLLESELGIEAGTRYVQDQNTVLLVGEIVNRYDFQGAHGTADGKPLGAILTLRTQDSGRYNFPKITFFKQIKLAMNVKPGDIVAVCGAIQTSKRDSGGETQYFENVVGSDIDYYRE